MSGPGDGAGATEHVGVGLGVGSFLWPGPFLPLWPPLTRAHTVLPPPLRDLSPAPVQLPRSPAGTTFPRGLSTSHRCLRPGLHPRLALCAVSRAPQPGLWLHSGAGAFSIWGGDPPFGLGHGHGALLCVREPRGTPCPRTSLFFVLNSVSAVCFIGGGGSFSCISGAPQVHLGEPCVGLSMVVGASRESPSAGPKCPPGLEGVGGPSHLPVGAPHQSQESGGGYTESTLGGGGRWYLLPWPLGLAGLPLIPTAQLLPPGTPGHWSSQGWSSSGKGRFCSWQEAPGGRGRCGAVIQGPPPSLQKRRTPGTPDR